MLRLFFGLFSNAATTDWWTIFGSDNARPQFQWGKATSLASHDIVPTKRHRPYYNGTPVVFDEYIDLPTAKFQDETAEFFAQFTNQAGVNTPYPVVSSANTSAVPNMVDVDGEIGDWLSPTRMLSEVFPPVTDPVFLRDFWVVNETMENDPSLAVTGYLSFAGAIKSGTDYGFCNDPCIVPYNVAATDVFRVMWNEPAGTITKIVIYRAPVVVSEVAQKFLNWPQWEAWRLVHNHLPVLERDPVGSTGPHSATYLLAKEATYPYPTPTRVNWAVFRPLNNALARMNLTWQKRGFTNYQVLLINTDSMTYWKGYLVKASSIFEHGIGATDDKAAQFSIAVTESGFCTIDALTAPNTGANFTAIPRST